MNTGNTNREQRINQIATGEFVEYRKRSTRRRPPGAPRRNTASRTAASAYHGQLDEVAPGKFQCPYCQATLLIDYDPGTHELKDASLKGDVQSTQVFAVHGKLTVKGDANKIWLLESSAEAQHVGNLDVKGAANTIRVVLHDGATYDLEGDANRIKHASSEEETEGLFTKLRKML